ncbi:endonuclease/exonuclease/phosphatase family protein [Pedobacter agri]|uniref:Endonuclease/exonuclease/phosphatase family protein n=1 Tax=Pedobacter agri TaxID=454586 RepID=A0A9X3DA62_9SPHI|nr:endonuclease/exonuclease/phosphatase family protein [Pedobacter agri]MCX3263484.1 endonuclease/exonuclease/phosphatase family protein [Pedobacter agri]
MSEFSRRNFVKGLGIALSASFIGNQAGAINQYASNQKFEDSHRILGCNIRVALPEDDALGRGWEARKDICIKIIKAQKPDIIGLQEVLRIQAEDIQKAMPDYFAFGFDGPEMDINKDTYNGIAKNLVIFSRKRYSMISAGCYWLSETPEIGGSLAWGTARARHANWVRLLDKKSGKEFRVISTHLDHKSQEARNKQGELIVKESNQYQRDFPQLLIGDFNVDAKNPVFKIITDGGWNETYLSVHGNAEPGLTAHNFIGEEYAKTKNTGKIDFIFTRGKMKTLSAKIIKDQINGVFPSDHFFVNAEVSLT